MTKKLYYDDPYKITFTEKILKKTKYQDKFAVVLAETYFYPTSGGQLYDLGSINGTELIEVIEEDDEILHLSNKEIPGDIADCVINWNRRFDFMQQHTGQHILSESISKSLGFDTISCHLGEDYCTIDINAFSLNPKDIARIEEYANNVIYKNHEVFIHYISDTEVSKFPLRKPPKFKGILRIVEIDGFDYSACGGTHLKRTGEVGVIKIRKTEKIKGNLTRLEFLCGRRALSDYQWKGFILNEVSNIFTTSEREIPEKVTKLIEENKSLLKQSELYKSELLDVEISKILNEAIPDNNYKIIKKIFKDRNISEIRIIAQKIIDKKGYLVVFGNVGDTSNIIFARSQDISLNMVQLFNSIAAMIDAKGGGKPDFVQAGIKNPAKLDDAIMFALRNIEL
jgi:alanyl-tRNA synthetase